MKLKGSAQRVQAALDASGIALQVREFPASTKTSQEAAAAVGCEVAQIAKSMIFRAVESDRPVLVMASGANRVDEKKLAVLLGEKVERATAEFVREKTGFAIGGVPPVGHLEPPIVLIDEDLTRLDALWAAAGTPNAVFRLTPAELQQLTGGKVAAVKQG
ncbi:MAG TPA: YbaK/EbsC family protein [Kiloniellales bacterium]|nr:YbaK/EbsC family protein [Kiloniellales bacterium]